MNGISDEWTYRIIRLFYDKIKGIYNRSGKLEGDFMFGIGVPELILILVVGLVVFGPGKLPEVARSLGKGIREFRKATNALSQAINAPEQRPVRPQQAPAAAEPAAAPVQEHAAANQPPKEAAAAAPAAAAAYQAPTQDSVRQQIAAEQAHGVSGTEEKKS